MMQEYRLNGSGVLLRACAEVAESKTAKSRKQLEKARAPPAWLTRKQRQRLKALLFWSFLVAGLLALVLIGVQENKVARHIPADPAPLSTPSTPHCREDGCMHLACFAAI